MEAIRLESGFLSNSACRRSVRVCEPRYFEGLHGGPEAGINVMFSKLSSFGESDTRRTLIEVRTWV